MEDKFHNGKREHNDQDKEETSKKEPEIIRCSYEDTTSHISKQILKKRRSSKNDFLHSIVNKYAKRLPCEGDKDENVRGGQPQRSIVESSSDHRNGYYH